MWSRGRRSVDRVTSAAGERLEHLSRQWRIPDAGSVTGAPVPDERPADHRYDTALDVTSWNRPALRGLALLVAIAVAMAGWWWWTGRPRDAVAAPAVVATGVPVPGTSAVPAPLGDAGSPSALSGPSASSRDVIVHVVGQVRHPGLVTLPAGSRVDAAIRAAGGVTRPRAADSVNLARILVDGEQVVVGFAAQAVAGVLGITSTKAGGLLNLNSADATAFEDLPGVGPVLAQRIVQWRTANGPFRSVDELGEVSGIGDAIMAQLRPLVTV